MLANYISKDSVLVDDSGVKGGLAADASFVIGGDLNASLNHGKLKDDKTAIEQLLGHPRINDPTEFMIFKKSLTETGTILKPDEPAPRWRNYNSRIDHLLPSKDLHPVDGGVYWPLEVDDKEGAALVDKASDHKLIWLDIEMTRPPED